MFDLIGGSFRDEISSLARSLGLPQCQKNIVVRKRWIERETEKDLLYTLENCYIDYVDINKKSSTGFSDYDLKFDDYVVKGISTNKYNKCDIIESGCTFYIGGVIKGNEVLEGIECELLHYKESLFTLDLLLRKKQDQRQDNRLNLNVDLY